MLVRVEKAQGYGYIARPNSERTAETMRLDMIENGAGGPGCTQWLKPDDVVAEIYLQEFSDVESELGDNQWCCRWEAQVRYQDGRTVRYEFWERRSDRPSPEGDGSWLLRLDRDRRTHYVTIPRGSEVEFRFLRME